MDPTLQQSPLFWYCSHTIPILISPPRAATATIFAFESITVVLNSNLIAPLLPLLRALAPISIPDLSLLSLSLSLWCSSRFTLRPPRPRFATATRKRMTRVPIMILPAAAAASVANASGATHPLRPSLP